MKKLFAIFTGLLGLSLSSTQSVANLPVAKRVERIQSALYQQSIDDTLKTPKNSSNKFSPDHISYWNNWGNWRDWRDWPNWPNWPNY